MGAAASALARRDLVWINVTTHPTADWIARQITEAFPWAEAPRYVIRDRDCVYGAAVTHRLPFERAEMPANCGLFVRDRETSVRIGLRGTRTSNQTVMSEVPSPDDPEKSDT
jgi:hypothetical protein